VTWMWTTEACLSLKSSHAKSCYIKFVEKFHKEKIILRMCGDLAYHCMLQYTSCWHNTNETPFHQYYIPQIGTTETLGSRYVYGITTHTLYKRSKHSPNYNKVKLKIKSRRITCRLGLLLPLPKLWLNSTYLGLGLGNWFPPIPSLGFYHGPWCM
jgi:hypothetical protein